MRKIIETEIDSKRQIKKDIKIKKQIEGEKAKKKQKRENDK
jgi:hypothetical protein